MKTKLSNIFSKLHILDNMYLNLPDGMGLDFLCDVFEKSNFNSLEQLVEALIDNVEELNDAEIFQYRRDELRKILEVREITKGDLINLFLTQENKSYFINWKYSKGQSVSMESTVSAVVSSCAKELIAIINEAVANGEFELSELFDMNPAIDDTNYHALNPSDIVLSEMEKAGLDSDDDELFDYIYGSVEKRVTPNSFFSN